MISSIFAGISPMRTHQARFDAVGQARGTALADSFSTVVAKQREVRATTRVLTVSDELLQELINLKS